MSESTLNTAPEARPRLTVVAGIIEDDSGQILLSQRPAHKHQGGRWEFPGGKVEAGESASQALARELEEELGLQVQASEPFMTVDHDYEALSVRLLFRRVTGWAGEPHGREGQPLGWFSLPQLTALTFPAANRPVVTALSLGEMLVVTPAKLPRDWPDVLEAALSAGARLVYARLQDLDQQTGQRLAEFLHARGAKLLVADDVALARRVGADGLHLTGRAQQAPLPEWHGLRSVACHDAAQLDLARRWQADLVTLGPVKPTRSHPGADGIGWAAFAGLATGQPFAVYALGGLGRGDLDDARRSGARGIAGISCFWRRQ